MIALVVVDDEGVANDVEGTVEIGADQSGVQRRVALLPVGEVHVGAGRLQQQLEDVGVAALHRLHHRRPPVAVLHVHIRPGGQQQADDAQIAVDGRQVQHRPTAAVQGVHVVLRLGVLPS